MAGRIRSSKMKLSFRRLGGCLLVGALILGIGPAQAQKCGDRIVPERGRLVLYSRTGIGSATLARGQAWADPLILRFCYENGRGMTRLEGLRLRGESLEARGSMHEPTFLLGGEAGQGRSLPVDFRLVDGAYEFTVPQELLAHSSFLEFHWVDAYR